MKPRRQHDIWVECLGFEAGLLGWNPDSTTFWQLRASSLTSPVLVVWFYDWDRNSFLIGLLRVR